MRTGTGIEKDMDKKRDTGGQGHRWTGTGTQMDSDRGRDTKGQRKGHKQTWTGIRTRI
jgi:hypothetical protein